MIEFKNKMIKIEIGVKDGKVYDSLDHKGSTLLENALAIRRLEEMKAELLGLDYEDDLLMEEE